MPLSQVLLPNDSVVIGDEHGATALPGLITLAIQVLEGRAILIVTDDGRGIDPEEVLAKALALQVISAQAAAKPP